MGLSSITAIPKIMRAKGWVNGATLLETWFARPPAIAPAYSAPVTDVIKLNWVLGFERAREVYDRLFAEKTYCNAAAKRELLELLRNRGWLPVAGGPPIAFGQLDRPAADLKRDATQFGAVADGLVMKAVRPLDDLVAALGNFAFRVNVAGTVAARPGGQYRVALSEVAVYVADSFDFEGDQPLGFWNEDNNTGAKTALSGGKPVANVTFRNWRAKNQKGGDFLVFSDVRRVKLTPPEEFDLG
jgi:hypothetical protein